MSEPLSAERLAEIRARAEAALDEVVRMCAEPPHLRWRWSIPANPQRDSDLILSGSLMDIPDLLAEVDRLAAENARLSAPGCGGPDCRMIGLHTVNTCPTYQERVPVYEKTWPASGPSRWFSAAHDERHGTDPAWDGTGE